MESATEKRIRSCVSCGNKQGKATLHRVVRPKEGRIHYDISGREPGRGAYVCSAACLEKALKTGKLARSLRAAIGEEEAERLRDQMAGL